MRLSVGQQAWRTNPSIGIPLRFDVGRSVLVLGLAALVLPTLLSLAKVHWSTEDGAHGPLILISGFWLLWRERSLMRLQPESISGAWLALPPLLLISYAYGRSFGLLGTESASLYGLLVLLGFCFWGSAVMRRLWFPILYLGFLVKPPYSLVAELTQPLKIAISQLSVDLLYAFGYPVGAAGVLVQIGAHELLVQQACAGLGSLLTLLAIGVLYVHLAQPLSRRHSALLLLSIVPIAMLANYLRVLILILLTYHFGDSVAQSFAHDLAGLVTFVLSLLGMFALDWLLTNLKPRRECGA